MDRWPKQPKNVDDFFFFFFFAFAKVPWAINKSKKREKKIAMTVLCRKTKCSHVISRNYNKEKCQI